MHFKKRSVKVINYIGKKGRTLGDKKDNFPLLNVVVEKELGDKFQCRVIGKSGKQLDETFTLEIERRKINFNN